MVTLHLQGRVLPLGVNISAEMPEIKWMWDEKAEELVFRTKVASSFVYIECDVSQYKPEYTAELYKRATDLAKVAVNLAAFATGYGLYVVMEVMTAPDGTRMLLHRQEHIPAEHRTAVSLAPEHRKDLRRTFQAVLTEVPAFIALDDLIRAVTSNHTSAADCGRAVDRIRRAIAPGLHGAPAWREMHRALNIDQTYQEWISRRSTGSRHGDSTFVPGSVGSEVTKRTWAILNRFLEYRRGGNVPLTAPKFPRLT